VFSSPPAATNLFSPDAVDPETAAFNSQLIANEVSKPHIADIGAAAERASRRADWLANGSPVSRLARERTIAGPGGAIPVRVLIPDTVQGVFLHFHGGGMAIGDAIYSDLSNEAIAVQCNVAVVSVNYRLAPEHPYPAAPDDSEAVALWLAANARAEFGTDRLAIGGDSAGATLSVATLVRLRDRHQLRPFRAANLVFGAYDFALTPSVLLNGRTTPVLDARRMQYFAQQYVPDQSRLREPDISPIWADLAGLPPALFTIGTMDPLLDDSLFMHARWLAAGNASQLAIFPGGTHLFTNQPTALAERAKDGIYHFLREALEG
jgi:acetyl esterase/lipase